jgi:hypothetical protein
VQPPSGGAYETSQLRKCRSPAVDGGNLDSVGLPGLSIRIHFDDRAQPGREHVLAVRRLRRGLECVPTGTGRARRAEMVKTASELARDVEALIAALDRRARQVDQAGEAAIARDAAALRAKAVDRLAELASEDEPRTAPPT